MTRFWMSVAAAAILAGCGPQGDAPGGGDTAPDSAAGEEASGAAEPAETAELADGEATLGDWGIETAHISDSVHPGDDFFTYVNEGWLETTEIPAGFANFGAFTELFLESEQRVNAIIQDSAAANAAPGTAQQQIGDLYASYMNTDRIEELGITPIQGELDAALNVSSHEEIVRLMANPGYQSIFGLGVTRDPGDPTRYILSTGQGGLGLPNRNYYVLDTEPFPAHRAAYIDYIEDMLELAGVDRARERAEAIMELETAIANVHWTPEERRDRERNYNLMTIDELIEFAPGFDWRAAMEERDVAGENEIVVNTDTAIQAMSEIFADTPVDVWSSYLAFHLIDNASGLLSSDYEQTSFDFRQRRLNGVEEQRARELRAIQYVNGNLGEVIGQVYVERHFPPEYKTQMDVLVEYLGRAFRERLETLEWMDDETRIEALAKLEAFIPKIGYPDVWRDFSSIEIRADDLHGNSRRVGEWFWEDSRSRLGGPIRDWEWFMSPQTVNAYYSSTSNEIVFPAAILQAPFFDPHADMAVNFGAIGGVIGHEMGHGFDDQGSRSDGSGVLRNWWTDFARESFEERTDALVAQYNEFSPIEGLNVNGAVSLGENIGDLGGLSISHHAYQLYLNDHHGGEAPVLDGFTGDQRFFMAWSQVWRVLWTEERLRRQLVTGPHSPGQYRANGVVRNMDAWYDAFGVGPEHDLYLPPEQRVSIW